MKKKTKESEPHVILKEVAKFDCAVHQNAVNIAIALAQAGRYVNITGGSSYSVRIYERL